MAHAPTPGVGARREAAAIAKTIVTITVRGETLRVAPFNLPLSEDLAWSEAVGQSMERVVGPQMGLSSVRKLWWLARRANGESTLTLADAWEQWPDNLDIATELDVTVEEPDVEASDPEA